jgi:hypothetical protein
MRLPTDKEPSSLRRHAADLIGAVKRFAEFCGANAPESVAAGEILSAAVCRCRVQPRGQPWNGGITMP